MRRQHSHFWIIIGIFCASIIIFKNQPAIAMWIGFLLAGYSAIANDSIQTLGTFLSSNRSMPWWVLWLFIGGILVATFTFGWFQGDIAFGRLEKIPEAVTFSHVQLLAPLILMVMTRYKMPVSTTFLLLSVFTDSKTIGKMLTKTFTGYFVAFIVALILWTIMRKITERIETPSNKKIWRVLQWGATGFLWVTWLMQDIANITVYLPRALSLNQFIILVAALFLGMGLLLYKRGGRIQEIITEKTAVTDPRAATLIDLVFAFILMYFKKVSNIPMSTTWVFLGLLAGREIAIQHFSKEKKHQKTLTLITKDLALASIGLIVSLAIAIAARPSILQELIVYVQKIIS